MPSNFSRNSVFGDRHEANTRGLLQSVCKATRSLVPAGQESKAPSRERVNFVWSRRRGRRRGRRPSEPSWEPIPPSNAFLSTSSVSPCHTQGQWQMKPPENYLVCWLHGKVPCLLRTMHQPSEPGDRHPEWMRGHRPCSIARSNFPHLTGRQDSSLKTPWTSFPVLSPRNGGRWFLEEACTVAGAFSSGRGCVGCTPAAVCRSARCRRSVITRRAPCAWRSGSSWDVLIPL